MPHRALLPLLCLAFACAVAVTGRAAIPVPATRVPAVYRIDSGHSTVQFKVKHLGISTVTGRFREFGGEITYDPDAPARSSVRATIQAASVDTDNEARDEDLRSADFFEVATYPTLTFASERVEPAGESRMRVHGDLTMHGVTRPVVLDVELGGSVTRGDGVRVVAFTAETEVDRRDYGLTWNRALETGGLLVSNEVRIILDIEARTGPAGG